MRLFRHHHLAQNCRSAIAEIAAVSATKTPMQTRSGTSDRSAICFWCPFSGHGFLAARSLECLAAHLQHFWHKAAYMQALWHTIAILPLLQLPPFVPIRPSGMDDLDDILDNSHILILIILITFLIAPLRRILYSYKL
ncbi:MAG: hypothetical protein JNM70_22710 [Anaerolineae bacterium]|nr:hypothetical protein [Anaerolineae bacterium]